MALDPAERERRRKARVRRSFSNDAYKHYDVGKEGFGSAAQWTATAEARLGDPTPSHEERDLVLLQLTALPTTLRALHRAYRLASRTAHPDSGGTDAAFNALGAARDRVEQTLRERGIV